MNNDDFLNEIKRRERLARDGRWMIAAAIVLFFVALLLLVVIGDRGTNKDSRIGFMGMLFSASVVIGVWGLTVLYRARK